jgi:hypothetical protein
MIAVVMSVDQILDGQWRNFLDGSLELVSLEEAHTKYPRALTFDVATRRQPETFPQVELVRYEP